MSSKNPTLVTPKMPGSAPAVLDRPSSAAAYSGDRSCQGLQENQRLPPEGKRPYTGLCYKTQYQKLSCICLAAAGQGAAQLLGSNAVSNINMRPSRYDPAVPLGRCIDKHI